MKTILVTNDDGIHGQGLLPLITELHKIARVIAIVPDQERSGMSHSITLHRPLWVKKVTKDVYITTGTPVDCVRFGVLHLINRKIDMVVSGINTGPNMGEDVIYSGTVAGAREGTLLGIPSFAVSLSSDENQNFKSAAAFSRKFANFIFTEGLPKSVYININYPRINKGVAITSLGKRTYDEKIAEREDPRGGKYYWLSGNILKSMLVRGTDVYAVEKNKISVTPLHLETTDPIIFKEIKKWEKDLS